MRSTVGWLTGALLLAASLAAQDPASRVAAGAQSRPTSDPGDDFASFAAGGITTGWLPIEARRDGYVVVRGRVNGIETNLMVDSGASRTLLDTAFADTLGLERFGEAIVRGVGGKQEAEYRAGVRIEIGSLTLRPPRVLGLDLRAVRGLGGNTPVIVGRQIFYQAVVDVDAPRSRLALHAFSRFVYDGPGRTVPLFPQETGEIFVEMQLEDLEPTRFVLDTGSANAVDVFRHYWSAQGLLDRRSPLSTATAGGIGGKLVSKVGSLRTVTIGGSRLQGVPASFIDDAAGGSFETTTVSGNLGMGLLSRFRFIIDYERERAHLEPEPGCETRPFWRNRIGFQGTFVDDALRINFVSDDSPAARAGLTTGQRIKAINGRQLTEASWKAIASELANVATGTEVSLTDAQGDTRKLVAADYY